MNFFQKYGASASPDIQAQTGPGGSFDIFPWHSDFETGIAFMDEEHRALVRMINLLARKLAIPSTRLSCNQVLKELREYAASHFGQEEALMRQYLPGDAIESEHLRLHQDFRAQIEQFGAMAADKQDCEIIENLVAFLSHWLAGHLLDMDRRAALVIQAVQAGTPLAEAKLQADQAMSGTMRKLIDAALRMYGIQSSSALRLMKEIAERQRTETILNEQRQIFATVFETALDGVVLMNSRGIITGWNKQAEEIFGWSKEEAIGRTISDTIIPARYHAPHAIGLANFLATGAGPILNHRIETIALHRDGHEFPVLLSVSPIRTGDSYEFSAFIRDISERKPQRTEDLTPAKNAAPAEPVVN